jgi:hypothetical protein
MQQLAAKPVVAELQPFACLVVRVSRRGVVLEWKRPMEPLAAAPEPGAFPKDMQKRQPEELLQRRSQACHAAGTCARV